MGSVRRRADGAYELSRHRCVFKRDTLCAGHLHSLLIRMARSQSLLSPEPTNLVHQPVTICHVFVSLNPTSLISARLTLSHRQLRDLVICPDERGVVNYVQEQCIMEHDISDPSSVSSPIAFFSISRSVLFPSSTLTRERVKTTFEKRG